MFTQRRNRRRTLIAAPYARPVSAAAENAKSEHPQAESPNVAAEIHNLEPTRATLPWSNRNQQLHGAQAGPARTPQQGHMHLSNAAASTFTIPVKLSHVCRFCNCTLSSSSNRLRHERLKHASELHSLPNTPAAGASRKQSCEGAFAKSSSSSAKNELETDASSSNSATGTMELEPQVQEHDSTSIDKPESADSVTHRQCHITSLDSDSEGKENEPDAPDQCEPTDSELAVSMAEPAAAQAACDDENLDESRSVMEMEAGEAPSSSPRQPQELHQQLQSTTAVDSTAGLEPGADQVLEAVGARPLLQEEDLQEACYPFLQWLASPCMTACEALVKAKRVKSISQLAPIKSSLRFVFALLYESKVIDAIGLRNLLRLSICQALYQAIVDRQVGSGRTHQIFLLVKKVLVFLSSTESAKSRQFVQPSSYESYTLVENITSESSNQRKQEARDRMVLGISGSRGALTQPKEVFQIPKTWNGDSQSSTSPAQLARAPPQPQPPQQQLQLVKVVQAAAGMALQPFANGVDALPLVDRARLEPLESSANRMMTKEELCKVTQSCLAYLTSMVELYTQPHDEKPSAETDLYFTHHLVTGMLCLGLAPRSQVLQQIKIGSSFTKEEDGRYWIKMSSSQSKNNRPTMFALAGELTRAVDVYLQFVRPRLLARCAAQHDWVFFKRSGVAPRTNFSSSTCLVTQAILGFPVNPHTFRSSLITTFYSSGASEAEMSTLASIMSHDPATARNFYFKPKHTEAAVQASQRMVEQLLATTPGRSASDANGLATAIVHPNMKW